MRALGLWHPRLLEVLAPAGHGELVVVADAGLPVPPDVETVDLVWYAEQPPFLPVVRAVLEECVVEHATVAAELTDPEVRSGLAETLDAIPVDDVSHEQLKALTAKARVVVRTGAVTPYSNVVLRCGVPF